MKKIIILLILGFPKNINAQTPTATCNVSINNTVMPESRLLMGITFDSRAGMLDINNNPTIGYFTPAGTLIQGIDSLFYDFPLSTLRYPANGIANGFDWKKSIGLPSSSRPPQDILGPLGNPQPVEWGFDEFVNWTISKGVSPEDLQIMVTIYDGNILWDSISQQNQSIPFVASHCADWVEYANSPADSLHPWAQVRASNGYPLPYGIKIWNMGNEPWSDKEFGMSASGCNNYLNTITPIIDSMLAVDSTIKITLATVGNVNSDWNTTILNSSLVASGKIYGLSPHAFPDETNPSTRVSQFLSTYPALASAAEVKGLKIFLGDYVHYIPVNATQAQMDIAMQWQGVTLCADFLLGISQINNIERVNFWAYGMPVIPYHPVRLLSGNYTLMPVAQFYKFLFPLLLDNSVSTVKSSLPGSDGNPYAVNSSAFASDDLMFMNVIAVNRDLTDTHIFQVTGTSGYNLTTARILTASGPDSENYILSYVLPDANGHFSMPPSSILVLEYTNSVLNASGALLNRICLSVYPNPFSGLATVNAGMLLDNCSYNLINCFGQTVASFENLSGQSFIINSISLSSGFYLVELVKNGKVIATEKIIINNK